MHYLISDVISHARTTCDIHLQSVFRHSRPQSHRFLVGEADNL